MFIRFSMVAPLLLGATLHLHAQKAPQAIQAPAKADSTQVDSSKNTPKPGTPKPYSEVVTKEAITHTGLFTVHRVDDNYLFEIPDSLLHRDILVVNRISKAAAGLRPNLAVFAGDQIAENVIRFETGPGDRIFIKRLSFQEKAEDTTENGMYRSLLRSSLHPIAAAFPIKAFGKDSSDHITSYVIDVTSFLQTENEIIHFSAPAKKQLALGAVQADKSYISSVKTYPLNIEISSMRTYLRTASGSDAASTLPISYELNSSLLVLPKTPMQPRYADARIGYFARGMVDFDSNPQGIKSVAYITRFRMEPKDADQEKYLRGELVEPKNPITYYIDPATPKKWIPYLIAGVNDWQAAFEQAGFKNAIKAVPAPQDDSTWSIDDARHNVLVYKPSAIADASGPHVHDPRSGEIMETHINWYHNIMSLVRNWYMIQAGAIDPRARRLEFDDELMGQLIRFVSSHEVGHTLGLMHNFGSSSTVPVEKLRDKAYLEKHGHTPSIMDYARFNYVAQPEDGVTEKGIFPRIGAYDKWAIQWGYRWLPQYASADAETPYLNQLIIDSLSANKHLFFGYEIESLDPRSQSEDLGDDAVKASMYGVKNLQRILPEVKNWTRKPNEGYEELRNAYEQVYRQYNLYAAHVLKSIGGRYHTPKSVEQSGDVYEPVPYERQKAAMKYLDDYVFHIPGWLSEEMNDQYGLAGFSPTPYFAAVQNTMLRRLQGSGILTGFLNDEAAGIPTYPPSEFLEDLKNSIWTELYNREPISLYRRNLQKTYVFNAFHEFDAVNEITGSNNGNGTIIYVNPDPTRSDVSSIIRAHLETLKKDMKKALKTQKGVSKSHLQDMIHRIDQKLAKIQE